MWTGFVGEATLALEGGKVEQDAEDNRPAVNLSSSPRSR